MKAFRRGVLVIVCSAAFSLPAAAADIILDGEAACHAIGGVWRYSASCEVARLVIPTGTRLVVASGVGFSVGDLVNDGVLETRSHFTPTGTLTNRGTLVTSGITVNSGPLYNFGTWVNHGWLHPHNAVFNERIFVNDGLFETCSGQFVNRGFMRNLNDIANWGGLIINIGLAVNEGVLYNPEGSYTIENHGAIDNLGTLENWGQVVGYCGSALYGAGTLLGNPVEAEPCEPELAVGVLGNVVLALHPAGVLSKDQTILLSSLLYKAGKRLEQGNEDAAVEQLEAFVAEVGRAVAAGVPEVFGRSLIARAANAIDLIVNP